MRELVFQLQRWMIFDIWFAKPTKMLISLISFNSQEYSLTNFYIDEWLERDQNDSERHFSESHSVHHTVMFGCVILLRGHKISIVLFFCPNVWRDVIRAAHVTRAVGRCSNRLAANLYSNCLVVVCPNLGQAGKLSVRPSSSWSIACGRLLFIDSMSCDILKF